MRRNYAAILSIVVLTLLAPRARGQMSADEAYKRMQERAAARAKTVAAPASSPTTTGAAPSAGASGNSSQLSGSAADPTSLLLRQRAQFKTVLMPGTNTPEISHEKPTPPPAKMARLVKYQAPLGELWAYITPGPGDGKRHPAVIWIHGGFAGLFPQLFSTTEPADDDQTPLAFVKAGCVVLIPSFRGHNDNPGEFEMFYGEVDDALAAVEYLSKVSYADPSRIYVIGHSTGGTMALLIAEASNRVRAAFSLCGCPDVAELIGNDPNHHGAPFDFNNPHEAYLRSAFNFVQGLKTPTWFFDNPKSLYAPEALDMQRRAEKAHAPFRAFIIDPATHTDVVRPITHLLAAKFLNDTGSVCNVEITPAEITAAYAEAFSGRQVDVETGATQVEIEVTDKGKSGFETLCKRENLDPTKAALVVDGTPGAYRVLYTDNVSEHALLIESNGVRVTMSDSIAATLGPATIDMNIQNGRAQLVLVPGK